MSDAWVIPSEPITNVIESTMSRSLDLGLVKEARYGAGEPDRGESEQRAEHHGCPEGRRSVVLGDRLALDECRAEPDIGEDEHQAREEHGHSGEPEVARLKQPDEDHAGDCPRDLDDDDEQTFPCEAAPDRTMEVERVCRCRRPLDPRWASSSCDSRVLPNLCVFRHDVLESAPHSQAYRTRCQVVRRLSARQARQPWCQRRPAGFGELSPVVGSAADDRIEVCGKIVGESSGSATPGGRRAAITRSPTGSRSRV